jgi:PAS domain S-box-containing protein
MGKIRTLVVDDEPDILDLTKIFLEVYQDIEVVQASSAIDALFFMGREEFDVVVSDYQMPSMDGLQLLRALKDQGSHIPFILFTGKGRESVVVEALNLGASYYLQKGGDPRVQFTELANMIRRSDEAQRSKKQLTDSENRFRNLVQNSSDFITIIDRKATVIYNSSSIEKILGYDENYLIGKSALDIVHPEDRGIVLTEIGLVTDNLHDGIPAEFRIRKADGQYIPVEAVGKNMFGVPNVDGLVITTRPVIERKNAEMAIRESEELYHTLFEKSPLSIVLNDVTGKFVDVNEKHLELIGLKKEDVLGKGPVELGYIGADDLQQLSVLLTRNGGTVDQYPTIIRLPNGNIRHLVTSIRTILSKGEVRILSMSDDMTDLVETKRDLQVNKKELDEEHSRLKMINDLTPNVVYQLLVRPDKSMQFLYVSKGAENMFHVPLQVWYEDFESIIGRTLQDDREPLMGSIYEVMVTKALWEREFRTVDIDGTQKWILGTSSPSPERPDGSVIWTGTLTDITERKKGEEMLRHMNHQLNLMTNITRHDCLNKIGAALGYLEIASGHGSDRNVNQLIAKAASSIVTIRSELEITRDLQDLSGQEPIWQEVEDVLTRSSITRSVEISKGCRNLEIYANPMLEKVFQNLVDNSVRHGGGVRTIRLECRKDDKGMTLLYKDDGIGIPDEEKEKVFVRGYGRNTGLGLFLIREILNMTHITIIENGIPGEGACFAISVPPDGYRFRV